jgi:hypothetical protein
MLPVKAGPYLSGAPLLGKFLALPTNIISGWKKLASDKHSSLLRKLVNYGHEKLHNIAPRSQCYETFFVCNLRIFVMS